MIDFEAQTTEELSLLLWDLYKEVHGIRPRWMTAETTREEIITLIKKLLNT